MRVFVWALVAMAFPSSLRAASLNDICTPAYAKAALPADGFFPGLTIDPESVQTTIALNATYSSEWYPTSTIDYCNITFAYSHDGIANDVVHVAYWVPAPDKFQNRYLSTGGGGLAINSGPGYVPSGVRVGAVSGLTDGGFGSFNTQWDAVFLLANNTINWQANYMFGYQAHHELAVLGKEFTKKLYGMSADTRLYSYYQGCSEGGREGWSQVQRFNDQFDGVVAGAPAFRYGQQQVNHLTSNVIQQTLNYYPPSCELDKIANMTIAACDVLDGKADGVVSRSDLCKLQFNVSSTIGTPYSCAASSGNGFGSKPTPAQNGTVTAEGAAVAQTILDGLHDSKGRFVYMSYQPGTTFVDGATEYDSTTGTWGVSVSGLGGEWVTRYLELQDTSTLSVAALSNYTYDTLKDLMVFGMNKYADSLQTTYPDLEGFRSSGGKVLHIHGEQDNSIPTGSSVHYYESVRSVMYGDLGYNESVSALDEFYRLFLVPGGAHCGANSYQANSSWPQNSLQTVIDWVESSKAPETLDGSGEIDTICRWPLRPLWTDGGATFSCVYDQESIDTWKYDFNAYNLPLY
ncbi:Tannase/feruloyl esterase [Camillea tinctor]|nr:Tannase/feruloyl esterase [Camillea tinctor]